ncbi:hypothetical protein SPD48_03365 [Pseudogracilibacillus sp. SE30717A]|uniref:YphA family membrane protein n=1 Tax=Pseudogracilibacillus sp. SE30717A TaxID=3098293 RepID=UPI00300DC7EE
MYEEFLYYWLIWIIFILVYFFMAIGSARSVLVSWILLLICCTNITIIFSNITFSITFFLLIIGAIIFYTVNEFTFYKMFATFSVMLGYVSLLIWRKITPVWFFMPSFFMISVISAILILVLIHEFYEQIAVALVAITFGQLLYEFIVISYRLNDVMGDRTFFIQISLIILFIIMNRFFQSSISKLSTFLRRKIA